VSQGLEVCLHLEIAEDHIAEPRAGSPSALEQATGGDKLQIDAIQERKIEEIVVELGSNDS